MLRVVKVVGYKIPLFGNPRIFPYGYLIVTDGTVRKRVAFGYRKDQYGRQLPPDRDYITFNRVRYGYRNTGSLYHPRIEITEYRRE